MRLLVSDVPVLKDLERGGLLGDLFGYAHGVSATDIFIRRSTGPVFADRIVKLGACIEELTAEELADATRLRRGDPRLSLCQAFAYVVAEARGHRLLASEGVLLGKAATAGLPTANLVWVCNELAERPSCDKDRLRAALHQISGEGPRRANLIALARRLGT